jgi:hypothetical protein
MDITQGCDRSRPQVVRDYANDLGDLIMMPSSIAEQRGMQSLL